MCDWNNNGRYDMQDAFISYHIHRSISGNKQKLSSSGDSGDVVIVIEVVLLVLGICYALGWVISCVDRGRERAKNVRRCASHWWNYCMD